MNAISKINAPDMVQIEALRMRKVPLTMNFMVSGTKESDLPKATKFEIAMVGRSNVGKSSLINFLAGQRNLARVGSTPGRTQLINLFDAGQFTLVDLPGYGFAYSPRETQAHWATAMSEFFETREGLIAVFLLIDIRRDITPEDQELSSWLQENGLNVICVHTKCDKVHKSQLAEIRKNTALKMRVSSDSIIATSAEKKLGLNALFFSIASLLDDAREDMLADTHEA